MYINNNREADLVNEAYKRATDPGRTGNDPTKSGRSGSYAAISRKTWSEVIRLYKESRS